MKRFIFISLAALVGFGCSGNSSNQTPSGPGGFGNMQRATTVEVAEVQQESISEIIRSYGNIRSQDNVRVSPQVSELVTRIHVDLGDTVSRGQVLATLRDITFRDQLRRDEAQLEQSRTAMRRDSTEFERARSLFDRELISSSDFDNSLVALQNSRANFRSAQAALTQSRQNLNNTRVTSSVDGVVTRRLISPGDLASAGSPIFEVSNLVGYEMRIFVPLADRRKIRAGQETHIRMSGEREYSARGVVSRVSPEMDAVTGLAEIVISLTDVQGDILPGSLAEASVTVQTNPEAVVIRRSAMVENVQTILDPESNTIRIDRSFNVFVSRGDSLVEMRPLQTRLEEGDRIEIISGVQAGERIVITGQGGLEDGSRIRVAGRERQRPDQQVQRSQDGDRESGQQRQAPRGERTQQADTTAN